MADRAFDIFIKRTITSIAKESWGRTKEAKDVRDSCAAFLATLDQYEAGSYQAGIGLAVAVLDPLQLAASCSSPKIAEMALGCLHKLVAHAWLQGESHVSVSSASQELIPAPDSDVVGRVVRLVIKCGESPNEALQLGVVRALLTFTTAEHFIAHGDCLMAAVRCVFNLALGADSESNKRTACNALLQILNTIVKRITAFQLYTASSSHVSSRRDSGTGDAQHTHPWGSDVPDHAMFPSRQLASAAPVITSSPSSDTASQRHPASPRHGAINGSMFHAGSAHGGSASSSSQHPPQQQHSSYGLATSERNSNNHTHPPSNNKSSSQVVMTSVLLSDASQRLQQQLEGGSLVPHGPLPNIPWHHPSAEATNGQTHAIARGRDSNGVGSVISRHRVSNSGSTDSHHTRHRGSNPGWFDRSAGVSTPGDHPPTAVGQAGPGFRERGNSLDLGPGGTSQAANGSNKATYEQQPGLLQQQQQPQQYGGDSRTAQLASLAALSDLQGLEAALASNRGLETQVTLTDGTDADMETPFAKVQQQQRVLHQQGDGGQDSGSHKASSRQDNLGETVAGMRGLAGLGPIPSISIATIGEEETNGHDAGGPAGMEARAAMFRPRGSPGSNRSSPGSDRQGHMSKSPFFSNNGALLGLRTPQQQSSPQHPPSQQTTPKHSKKTVALNISERDVLVVLTAFCKLASRESGVTEVESYLYQGKLLALELIVKVLHNPQHRWDNVRDVFCAAVRQPLCIALLRNCTSIDPSAFSLAVRLLLGIMLQPQLRRSLKAELGAFYPLLLLRPIENTTSGRLAIATTSPPPSLPATIAAAASSSDLRSILHTLDTQLIALGSLKTLSGDPQLVVDLFVNYDCDLTAPSLYERTIQAVSLLSRQPWPQNVRDLPAKAEAELAGRLSSVRDSALRVIFNVLICLDAWSSPLKEPAQGSSSGSSTGGLPPLPHGSMLAGSETGGGDGAGSVSGHLRHPRRSKAEGPDGGEAGGLGELGSSAPLTSESERFEATRTYKASLITGLALFNSGSPVKGINQLLKSGIIERSHAHVATFLRSNCDTLDRAAVGEYFGHHEDFEIGVMHAFIDQESYLSQPIDGALRRLLDQFRLPGEAQKIDRIMEKFAERYCRDNPNRFRNADAAYVLSFAIIMLNTDAHNPLVDRRLGKQDFVMMNQEAVGEEPEYVSVLPTPELEEIYDRIVAHEIVMRLDGSSATRSEAALAKARSSRNKLAAALGIGNFSFAQAAKQGTEQQQRKQLLEGAARAVARGSNGMWYTSTDAELARPMLAVSGGAMQEALFGCLSVAADVKTMEAALTALLLLIDLAILLQTDALCERCVASVAAATGLGGQSPSHAQRKPAQYGSFEEMKQLASLQALIALPCRSESGLMGSSWPLVLRTISGLNALLQELTKPLPAFEGGLTNEGPISALYGGAGSVNPSSASGTLGKMFQAFGLGGSYSAGGNTVSATAPRMIQVPRASLTGGIGQATYLPAAVRAAPGASLVVWAQTPEGFASIEQVFSRSVTLDGDAVVVFMRALCAVSREELELSKRPGVYSLERAVGCAHANIGRIRLIWAKLWGVVSAHLVMASCHSFSTVAMFAVSSLRSLMFKLLGRAELAHFRHQEDALRPFVAVLRQCDDLGVRGSAVQCVAQAIKMYSRSLGSGWRMALEVLRRAAVDTSVQVRRQALDALQLVVEALYRGPSTGHECFRECVRAALALVSHMEDEDLAVEALALLHSCGDRLAEQHLYTKPNGVAVSNSLSVGSAHNSSSHIFQMASTPAFMHSSSLRQTASMLQLDCHETDDDWTMLLNILADIVVNDPRPAVTHASVTAAFNLMHSHSSRWTEATWHAMLSRVLQHLFRVPSDLSPSPHTAQTKPSLAQTNSRPRSGRLNSDSAEQQPVNLPSSSKLKQQQTSSLPPSFLTRVETFYPLVCLQMAKVSPAHRRDLIVQLASIALQWATHLWEELAQAGLRCLTGLLRCLQGDNASCAVVLDEVRLAVAHQLQLVGQAILALRSKAREEQAASMWRGGRRPAAELQPAGIEAAERALGVSGLASSASQVLLGEPGAMAGRSDSAASLGNWGPGIVGGVSSVDTLSAEADHHLLRQRCRMLLLMQRTLAALLVQQHDSSGGGGEGDLVTSRGCGDCWEVSSQVIALITSITTQAMLFNMRLPPSPPSPPTPPPISTQQASMPAQYSHDCSNGSLSPFPNHASSEDALQGSISRPEVLEEQVAVLPDAEAGKAESGWEDGWEDDDEEGVVDNPPDVASSAVPAAPPIIRTTSARLQSNTVTPLALSTLQPPTPSAPSVSDLAARQDSESVLKGSGPALFMRMPATSAAPLLASEGSSDQLLPCLAVLECEGSHIILDTLQRFMSTAALAAAPAMEAAPGLTSSPTQETHTMHAEHHNPHSFSDASTAAYASTSSPSSSAADLLLAFCRRLISVEVHSMQQRHHLTATGKGIIKNFTEAEGTRTYPWDTAVTSPALQLPDATPAFTSPASVLPPVSSGWDVALRGPVVARAVQAHIALLMLHPATTPAPSASLGPVERSAAHNSASISQHQDHTDVVSRESDGSEVGEGTWATVVAKGATKSVDSPVGHGNDVPGGGDGRGLEQQAQQRSRLMSMWPDMLVLMMCEQTVVRQAVAEYFEAVGRLAGLTRV